MPTNHPRIPCRFAEPPPVDKEGRPMRSHCVNGRIVHFVTGDEMDCHMCKGRGTIRDPATYVCNACGGSMLAEYPAWFDRKNGCNPDAPFGVVDEKYTGGYESDHLFDMTTYEWSMCEKCLRNMFERFVVKPHVSDYVCGEGRTYGEDSKHYHYRMWHRSEASLEWARSGKCNSALECPNPATRRNFTSENVDADTCSCEEHALDPERSNCESVPFEKVPDLVKVRYFHYEGKPYDWTPEERLIIQEAAATTRYAAWVKKLRAEYAAKGLVFDVDESGDESGDE